VDDQTVLASARPRASLVVRQGTQVGTTFPLTGDVVIIGREEGAEVSIQDPEVSRQHARISWQAGRYVLEDLGSTNGTYLNGVQITSPQPLQPGDTVGMGQAVLVFEAQPEATLAQPVVAPVQPIPPPSQAAQPAEPKSGRSRCLLWGCGCLALLGLLVLIAAAMAMLFIPTQIEDLLNGILNSIGLELDLAMLYVTHLLA
jgi:hypothetical protein